MEGVEDDEPSSKRLKVSSEESVDLSNVTSLREKGSSSLAASMASQEDDEVVGSKGVIKRDELVRVITDALYSLGYSKTGALLEQESGIPLHSTVVNSFVKQILDGKWDESMKMLHDIGLEDQSIINKASFVILEQKFFELLDGEKITDALYTLRTEIEPLGINDDSVRELSSFVIFPLQSGQESRLESPREVLDKMRKFLPPAVLMPEQRLVHLLEQALNSQRDNTRRFPNYLVGDVSNLTDCQRNQIPHQTLQVLNEHRDEVWFVQFSHNGKYLASSSRDGSVIIWEMVNIIGGGPVSISRKHTLEGHEKPVKYLSWRPDDSQILSCGEKEAVRRWDVASGQCLSVYEKTKAGASLVSCGWGLDADVLCIFSCANDKSLIYLALKGKEVECWVDMTLSNADMAVSSNGKEIITICKNNEISIFEWETYNKKFVREEHWIISFALSRDDSFLLISLVNEELHLWNIGGTTTSLVAKYMGGHKLVRCCFGGSAQSFVASGSEDSTIYVWNRESRELVAKLHGHHNEAVCCVSWNPSNYNILASASDDHTVRIWGTNQVDWKVHNGDEDTEVGNDSTEAVV